MAALRSRRLLDYSLTWRRYVISREARDWSVRGARSDLRYVRINGCISIRHNDYWPVENETLSLVNRAGHFRHRIDVSGCVQSHFVQKNLFHTKSR